MSQSLANKTQVDKFRLNCCKLDFSWPVNKLSELSKGVNIEVAAHGHCLTISKNSE